MLRRKEKIKKVVARIMGSFGMGVLNIFTLISCRCICLVSGLNDQLMGDLTEMSYITRSSRLSVKNWWPIPLIAALLNKEK